MPQTPEKRSQSPCPSKNGNSSKIRFKCSGNFAVRPQKINVSEALALRPRLWDHPIERFGAEEHCVGAPLDLVS